MNDNNDSKAFLGTGWGYPPEFYRENGSIVVRTVSEEEDIRESLKILLYTRPGERVMHPTYGCAIHTKVYEQITEGTVTEMKDMISRAVLFFEPRITLNSIDIETDEALDGRLRIQLNYTVRKTNNRSNVVFPFYYLEGTRVRL